MTHEIIFYLNPLGNTKSLSKLILDIKKTSIYIHTNNLAHAQSISRMLWQHPKDRFIANAMNTDCPSAVISIGYTSIPADRKFIINASNQLISPTHIEWVVGTKDSDAVAEARKRYTEWKRLGHPLTYISV